MSDKEKLNTLYKLLRSIKKDVTYIKDVKTSDYPEWTSELKDYVRERTEGWKSSYYLDPKTKKYVFSFAKAFRNLFEFWIFPNRVCPFHCYYSNRYDYVLFSFIINMNGMKKVDYIVLKKRDLCVKDYLTL